MPKRNQEEISKEATSLTSNLNRSEEMPSPLSIRDLASPSVQFLPNAQEKTTTQILANESNDDEENELCYLLDGCAINSQSVKKISLQTDSHTIPQRSDENYNGKFFASSKFAQQDSCFIRPPSPQQT